MRLKLINLLLITTLILSSTFSFSQNLNFVPMDENFKLAQKFNNTDTVLVVIPENQSDNLLNKNRIESYVLWSAKPVYIYKNESELTQEDLSKHIQLCGPYYKFKTKELLNIPITQLKDGFAIPGMNFCNKGDAFIYINDNATRFYVCSNTAQPFYLHVMYGTGTYQLYITNNDDMIYSGNYPTNSVGIAMNDLCQYRKKYFISKSLTNFDLHVAANLNSDSIFNIASTDLDKYVSKLLDSLELPSGYLMKTKLFIYDNMIDLQKFIAQPLWSTVYGKSVGNSNHSSGYNLATIKHEITHTIINQQIGENYNCFYSEGFRQYTEYFFDTTAYKRDIEVLILNKNLLDTELLKGEANVFFKGAKHYNISGVYVKHIIDIMGLTEFKKEYSNNSIEKILSEKYGYSSKKLITEIKDKFD